MSWHKYAWSVQNDNFVVTGSLHDLTVLTAYVDPVRHNERIWVSSLWHICCCSQSCLQSGNSLSAGEKNIYFSTNTHKHTVDQTWSHAKLLASGDYTELGSVDWVVANILMLNSPQTALVSSHYWNRVLRSLPGQKHVLHLQVKLFRLK